MSSGAIASGLAPLGISRRPRDLATQQASASVGQLVLGHAYVSSFARYGLRVGQVLLTSDDVVRRSHYRNAQRTLSRLLALGVVPVVNENDTVATEEIRFGDNDRLAALVAYLVGADALVLLSDVDALYDGDPRRTDAKRIARCRTTRTWRTCKRTTRAPTSAPAAWPPSWPRPAWPRRRASRYSSPPPTTRPRALGPGRRRHRLRRRRPPPDPDGASGSPTPRTRTANSNWTTAPSAPWWTAADHCWPPASPRWPATSKRATSWS